MNEKNFFPTRIDNDDKISLDLRLVRNLVNELLKHDEQLDDFYNPWLKDTINTYGRNLITLKFPGNHIQGDNLGRILFYYQLIYSFIIRLSLAEILTKWESQGRSSLLRDYQSCSPNKALKELELVFLNDYFSNFKISLFPERDYFSVPISIFDNSLKELMHQLITNLIQLKVEKQVASHDFFKQLYLALVPRVIRHRLGEYFTPEWMVKIIFNDLLAESLKNPGRILDPGCGSGTFIIQGIHQVKKISNSNQDDPKTCLQKILDSVQGIDLNPISVLAARCNYVIQIVNLLGSNNDEIKIPIFLADSILDDLKIGQFDHVVGNPPWISWDLLPKEYRNRTKEFWKYHGLFSLDARQARHGGSKKDLSMLFTHVVAEKYLKHGGLLAFLITKTIFKTKGAGDGFRRFKLGSGTPLKILQVHDLTSLKPFQNASTMTSILILQKGSPTTYPVPYYSWSKIDGQIHYKILNAMPVNPEKCTAPWITLPENRMELRKIFGRSFYKAREGINTGGANGVFWLKIIEKKGNGLVRVINQPKQGKNKVPQVQALMESKNIHPLLKGKNIKKWSITPSGLYVLVVQDPVLKRGIPPEILARKFPLQFSYLKKFKNMLESRALYKKYFAASNAPFYSMYNLQVESFRPYKVAWSRMGKNIEAAVIKPINDKFLGTVIPLPQETISYVPFDDLNEANFFCGMMNSNLSNEFVQSYSVLGGKGFASTHVLQHLNIPKFNPKDEYHVELAKLARTLNERSGVLGKEEVEAIESRITRISARIYDASESLL
ncbi:MAG: N-6 DNA methylase [Candidatus Helarchaeales archaeon]